jgi:hypothetical protein
MNHTIHIISHNNILGSILGTLGKPVGKLRELDGTLREQVENLVGTSKFKKSKIALKSTLHG